MKQMQAKIVVGLQYGDEGKGLVTDYLCKGSRTIVVRYTGGHQAGHTVVKDGLKHVFASFGSGTLRGCPTYVSEHCCMYPPFLENERDALRKKGFRPEIFFHPKTKVTTPYDIAYNRVQERKNNHGSVGVGIGATMHRSLNTPYKLYVADMGDNFVFLSKLESIYKYYKSLLTSQSDIEYFDSVVLDHLAKFLHVCHKGYRVRLYDFLSDFETIVFEGAQGIMLDMEHGVFPHVTYGYTTTKNAHEICEYLNIPSEFRHVYYVTRCYMTRHGNGPIPNTEPVKLTNNAEETNVFNEWQKDFKVQELHLPSMIYALNWDGIHSGFVKKTMVITCLDQRRNFSFPKHYFKYHINEFLESHSPDSSEIIKCLTLS